MHNQPCCFSFAPFARPVLFLADMGVPAEAVAEAYDAWEKGEVSSPLTAAAISNQVRMH